MFHLPAPLTPAPGRAGSLGVPGAGGAAGGKGAIDLPDFMIFALPGAPAMAPGKARQDPAGGGEAVPGGAVIASPAGHPDSHAPMNGTAVAPDLPIAAAKPADAPTRSDRPSEGAGKIAAKQRHSDDGNTDTAPNDPNDPLGLNALIDVAPNQAAPAVPGPPTVAAAVRSPDASAPSGSLVPGLLPDVARPVGETRPHVTQVREAAGGVSLGTIAQMPGVVVPVQPRAMPAGYAPATAAASVEPSAPAAALPAMPAMPASVATFLASVAPRSFAMPKSGALSDALAKAAPQPATAVVSSPTVAAPAGSAPVVIQSAGQLFAEAIHAATGQRDRPNRAPVDAIVAAAGTLTAPTSATAAPVIDRAPLDMTQAHWPTKMIERIETLRDAADAQDTRIRLIPDALGAIDVSMRRDGDTVRVHLAAERPETRAMIADAQPRLAELGEQRGLKIAASSGQGSAQAGTQDFHQPRGNPAPQQSARPASARAGDQPATDDEGDRRVA